METTKVGKRGTVVLPAPLRKRYGLEEGSILIAEDHADGILIRPAVVMPIEVYSTQRKAEFLLNNATDPADYDRARRQVRELGIDPDAIPHDKPEPRQRKRSR